MTTYAKFEEKKILNFDIGSVNIISKIYFMFMWFIGSPALLIFIIVYAFIDYDTIGNKNGSTEIYPNWSNVIGKKTI